LNEGLFPANRLAQINGNDPPPSLHSHYSRFLATTRQSAPLRRIGTFGLAVAATCAFPLASPVRFPRPYQSLVELRAAYTPDATRSVSGHPPSWSRRKCQPPVLTSS